MALYFQKTFNQSLEKIGFNSKYHKITIHDLKEVRTLHTSDDIVGRYGEAKWKIVDLLNSYYQQEFNLHNWLENNENDEVSYFLSEAGSNCLNYSEFKSPANFHLWCGEHGFVIGIEQHGEGFPAIEIDKQKIKENKGAAFNFFRNCQSKIFFNNPNKANIIFMEYLIKNV